MVHPPRDADPKEAGLRGINVVADKFPFGDDAVFQPPSPNRHAIADAAFVHDLRASRRQGWVGDLLFAFRPKSGDLPNEAIGDAVLPLAQDEDGQSPTPNESAKVKGRQEGVLKAQVQFAEIHRRIQARGK